MKTTILLISLATLASCATVTQKKCEDADWREIGKRDGMQGSSGYYNSKIVNACRQEFGIDANETQYNIGYQQGLEVYCSANRARKQGLNNSSYNPDLCAIETRHIATRAYYQGKLERISMVLDELYEQQLKIHRHLDELERQVSTSSISNPQLLSRIEALQEEVDQQSRKLRESKANQ